uniref:endonuclease VII domain-containing protein n=1 Tax=Streptomyces sp. SS7 TaxID=3108485 RepID=UPI00403FE523
MRQYACEDCGAIGVQTSVRGRPRKYCPKCAQERISARNKAAKSIRGATFNCEECGTIGDQASRGRPRKYCPECSKKLRHSSDRVNPSKAIYTAHIKRAYGITAREYEAMLERQGGRCAICAIPSESSKRRLAVDHCHRTGRVRGLLCGLCNTAIGKLKDDPVLLLKAVSYLERGT